MKRVILDTEEMYCAIDFSTGFPIVHLKLHNGITPTLYKFIKQTLLEDMLITLGTLGYDTLFSILPEDDKKAIKFNKAMGFEEERVVDGMMFLAQDTA